MAPDATNGKMTGLLGESLREVAEAVGGDLRPYAAVRGLAGSERGLQRVSYQGMARAARATPTSATGSQCETVHGLIARLARPRWRRSSASSIR